MQFPPEETENANKNNVEEEEKNLRKEAVLQRSASGPLLPYIDKTKQLANSKFL